MTAALILIGIGAGVTIGILLAATKMLLEGKDLRR